MNYYNYFTEIEEAFVRRRGRNLLLSPLDWALIESWQDRGIPLHIVLRAIESVFDTMDKNPGRVRTVKSISYCREEIEAQYAEWITSRAGSSSETEGEEVSTGHTKASVTEHVGDVIAALAENKNPVLKEDLTRAVARLEELKQGITADIEAAENGLTDIEKFIDQALLTRTDNAHLSKLKAEIEAQIGSYRASMGEESYNHTAELMLIKKLRESEEIPPLSLFYL